jgi:hypothetical protein
MRMVKKALRLPLSNGFIASTVPCIHPSSERVEGQVIRLKMIERQMYWREHVRVIDLSNGDLRLPNIN